MWSAHHFDLLNYKLLPLQTDYFEKIAIESSAVKEQEQKTLLADAVKLQQLMDEAVVLKL